MDDSPFLRPMTAAEVEQLVDWAALEGWNPGLSDAPAFYAADPDGYLAAEVRGEFVAGGAIVRHHAGFGFMGLFIVRPDYRGKGLGRTLWYARRDRLASRLAPGGTIGMDAVEAMRGFYARGGFREVARHVRFQLAQPVLAADDSQRFLPLNQVPFEQLAEFDRTCFPSPRDAYLRAWIAQATSCSFATVEGGGLAGYAVVRRCRAGSKIGPLFADSRAVATRLFRRCCQAAADGPVFLDIPEENAEAVAMAKEFGMQAVFSCIRMYRGPMPNLQTERIFGVTTLELG